MATALDVRRRRLLGTALLGLAPALPVEAAEALLITAVNKSGASAVAALLLAEIYRRADLTLRIEVLPPPRAGHQTVQGSADGELIRIQSYGDEHPQLLRVEPAYYRASVRAYAMPASNATVRNAEDVKRYSTGAIRGMAYVAKITENHPSLTLTQSPQQLFRMLAAGRVELALSTSQAAQSAMLALGLKDIVASPELVRFELFHYLHASRKELAPRLGQIIRKMRDSGELEQLIQQHEAATALAERLEATQAK